MNVVDTSAIVAVLFDEPERPRLERALADEPCVMSAATRVELGVVIEARTGPAGAQLLEELLERIGMEIAPVDAELAAEALVCWRRFGKGRHRAGLNLGDTFSYGLARQLGRPLLFVGDDFAATDVTSA
ncbi:MAG: type II toxin-antitoxin system VapC family toxin [Acidimicrobiia bacterium]|nr:type II toxin-antitoxin system VapC family toxin [Acidimicrobiia bacterium]